MTNSDYLLKAAIKKVTEKLNDILVEKIEEASNIAQDVPEMIIKEFDTLKASILEEATRMEKDEKQQRTNETPDTIHEDTTLKALEKDRLSVLLNAPCHQKILFEKIIRKKLF